MCLCYLGIFNYFICYLIIIILNYFNWWLSVCKYLQLETVELYYQEKPNNQTLQLHNFFQRDRLIDKDRESEHILFPGS